MKPRTVWFRRILIFGGAILVIGCLAAAGFLVFRSQTTPTIGQAAFVHIATPGDGTVAALDARHNIVAEAYAGGGIRELQLWVNNQEWGTVAPTRSRDRLIQTWDWTPSGEGEHLLVARLIAADGTVAESPLVRVYASKALNVLFPVEYETKLGDTAAAIAAQYNSDLQDLLASNPHLDPTGSLPAGIDLTVPVPVVDPSPQVTDFGEPAAPPAGGLVLPNDSQAVDLIKDVQAAQAPALWKAFSFHDGILEPYEPVELLYLYLSVDGKDWGRIPKNPNEYLHPQGGVFDLTSYLQQVASQAGGGPVQIHAEAWGWRGGELVFLGSYFGDVTTEGGGLQITPSGGTQLRIIDYIYLGKEHYKQFASLAGDSPDLGESFRWTTTLPGVTYALWQISESAFPQGATLNPPGLIHQGLSHGSGGSFDLDFAQYFGSGGGGGGFGGLGGLGNLNLPSSLDDLLGVNKEPTKQFIPWLPKAFFVRVIPMQGQYFPGVPGFVAGPPSPPVFVFYSPKGGYSPKVPPSGPAYEAHVVGFESYRRADPAYSACYIASFDYTSCNQLVNPPSCSVAFPKGTLSCGCPGVSCESSGSSCGELSLEGASDCLQDAGNAIGGAVGSAFSLGSSLYNGAVDFVTDTLTSVACGGLSGDARKVCEAGVAIGVNAGLASLGLPPQIPDFDKLMNEGLDYALAYAADEISAQLGFECDKFCQDMIKAGIEGIKNPDKLYDDGLAFAAERAQAALKDLAAENGIDWDCDTTCQGLIENAAKGEFKPGPLLAAQLDKAADEAAGALNAKGYPCNKGCWQAIRDGLEDSRTLVVSAANAAASKPPPPLFVPHELATEQMAVLTVEIFRRFESGNIPQEDLDQCGLTIFTSEATHVGTSQFTFSPFYGQGIEIPAMNPGDTIRLPIVLSRKFTDLTPEMGQAVYNEMLAKGKVTGSMSNAQGLAIGVITESGTISGENLATWLEMYYGGVLQAKLSGTPFITAAGGGQTLPCVADETWSIPIAEP